MPIHFLHIGKTGGGSIRGALRPAVRQRCGIAIGHHTLGAREVANGPLFFTVRDPITRFVSAFNTRARRESTEWWPDEMIAFSRYRTPNDLAEALPHERAARLAMMCESTSMNGFRHLRTNGSRPTGRVWFGSAFRKAWQRISRF